MSTASSSSNIDEVIRWLEQFVRNFNFTLPGHDQNMGRDLAKVVAFAIADRASVESRGADPTQWDAVTDERKKEKEKAYGWTEPDGKPNYATGQMLSLDSLYGSTVIMPDLVEMKYGRNLPPDRSFSPIDNRTQAQKEADESVTDTDKAGWAHEMGRDFYEIDDDIEAITIEEARVHLEDYIRREG